MLSNTNNDYSDDDEDIFFGLILNRSYAHEG